MDIINFNDHYLKKDKFLDDLKQHIKKLSDKTNNEYDYPQLIFEEVSDTLLERRKNDCNKGTFGTLACVTGSYGMAGAAMLCASAACCSGAGIVKTILPDKIYPIVAGNVWESVFVPLKTSDEGTLCADDTDKIIEEIEKCSAVVVGCGLKVTKDTEYIVCEILKRCTKPVILDADGINCISKHIDVLKEREFQTIITPHPGEMSRLCGKSVAEIQKNRINIAKSFANEYGCIAALKGVGTVIHNGKHGCINPSGTGALATAGTGDVLAGIIGALVCQDIDCFKSVIAGVYLHGLCAEYLAETYSLAGTTASDLLTALKIIS